MRGIENLKRLLDFMFQGVTLALTIDRDGDGKIEIGEIFAAVTSSAVMSIPAVFKDMPEMKAEFKDLTAEEIQELADYCKEKDYFPADFDDLEEFIKRTLLMIAYNARYTDYAIAHFKKD